MARPRLPSDPNRAQERLRQVRAQIAALDRICSGTLHRRTKMCGKPTCACRRSTGRRHGPYYQWSRGKGGRQENMVIPAQAVPRFQRAVANYRTLRRLLRAWEDESARLMLLKAPLDEETNPDDSDT